MIESTEKKVYKNNYSPGAMNKSLNTHYELGVLIANKIEETQFLEKFVRIRFLKWWKKREKVGMRFDWKLVARCYTICKQLRKQGDHFTVVVGADVVTNSPVPSSA